MSLFNLGFNPLKRVKDHAQRHLVLGRLALRILALEPASATQPARVPAIATRLFLAAYLARLPRDKQTLTFGRHGLIDFRGVGAPDGLHDGERRTSRQLVRQLRTVEIKQLVSSVSLNLPTLLCRYPVPRYPQCFCLVWCFAALIGVIYRCCQLSPVVLLSLLCRVDARLLLLEMIHGVAQVAPAGAPVYM